MRLNATVPSLLSEQDWESCQMISEAEVVVGTSFLRIQSGAQGDSLTELRFIVEPLWFSAAKCLYGVRG